MKIGVYLENIEPDKGGASSLLDTIRTELSGIKTKYQYVILYRGKISDKYKFTKDGMDFVNLNKARLRYIMRAKFRNLRRFKEIVADKFSGRWYERNAISYWDILCQKEKIDLIWFTFPAHENINYPYIWTLWDLGHRNYPGLPEMGRGFEWYRRENRCKQMLYKAMYVITGNETGKNEILDNYAIASDKIRVVHFPITSFCRGEEKCPEWMIPADKKYFLYPAQFWSHKNHIRIIEAIHQLKEEGFDVNVIFTGADKGNQSYLEAETKKRNIEKQVVFAGFVTDEELNYLYRHACGLCYASLLGPNNLPPNEACYAGCPVIVSDLPGHIEQLGEAAVYFDRFSSEDLAKKMKLILEDKEFTNNLIENGKRYAESLRDYSYTKTMVRIFDEFEQLLKTYSNGC